MNTLPSLDARSLPDWARFYRGRRVFITGHTGFKGSWLCEWLLSLGAHVTGFSLEPETDPALFYQLELQSRIDHHTGDVRDPVALSRALTKSRPDVIFHLAAQPLVRRSYTDPAGTHETNFLGTVRLLEILRTRQSPCAAVMVTSDKCYENTGIQRGYREGDRLGGHDPYSTSKACAELAVNSYRRSFFGGNDGKPGPIRVASARAGNVIGGGDWSEDRIVPDCIRSLAANEAVPVRSKFAVRPWQHVLEPLAGYLLLAAHIHPDNDGARKPLHHELDAFNFGPPNGSERTVKDLVEEILLHWPGRWVDYSPEFSPHEASLLTLDVSKAAKLLAWKPRWDFAETVRQTVTWYRAAVEKDNPAIAALTREQIESYMQAWARSPAPARRKTRRKSSRTTRPHLIS